jgi:FAD-linked sulfhydryl oxidase
MDKFKNYDDPAYYGPGVWYAIHKIAHTYNDKRAAKYIRNLIETFPCIKCRNHAIEYLKLNPIEKSIGKMLNKNGKQLPLGLFVWTWIFHNSVNLRIGKPQMKLSDAIETMEPNEMCSEMCDATK